MDRLREGQGELKISHDLRSQNIIVTGGSGFVGSHVSEELVSCGADVTVLSRTPPSNSNVKHIPLDLRDADAARRVGNSCTGQFAAIVHCAAMDGNAKYKQENASEILESNVRIALNTFALCELVKVSKVVVISSAEVYRSGQNIPVVEADPFGSPVDFQNNGYLTSKIILEYLAAQYRILLGNRVVVVRPSNVYGPGDKLENGRLIPNVIHSCLNGLPIDIWGDGKQRRSFLHVDDLSRAIRCLIELEVCPDEVNISAAKDSVISDVVATIVRLTGTSSQIRLCPDLPSGHAVPKFDISRLSSLIDFEFRDLESGLIETVESFKSRMSAVSATNGVLRK
ncbi:MAG: NAD(P)-dependent oxidoreductase [Acidimicrobiaceae bacterium]|nr:NAD(P)-dependent oxidoreductase [Acidimicrobiaceae bacterium]